MMEGKKISVIIPIYKVENFLEKCVESIRNQTYKNLEIILVDDGSPDNCPKMCDDYAEKDERIKVVHRENGGLAEARNSGLEVATGDFVVFMDSDDFIDPDTYEMLYKMITENNADMAMCGLVRETIEGEITDSRKSDDTVQVWDGNEFLCKLLSMQWGLGYAWNKLYTAESIKGHKYLKTDGCAEDINFNYRYGKGISKVVFCNLPKYHYVVRDGAITRSGDTFEQTGFTLVESFYKFLEEQKDNKVVYPYCVKGYTDAAFTVLSMVITSGKCMNRFNELRDGIIACRSHIFNDGLHLKKDRIKVNLLKFSPWLYKIVIKKIRNE